MHEETALFPKQIKIDDYEPFEEGNILRIVETSNLLVGSGARTSNAAIVLAKTLHYLSDEGSLQIKNKRILELGAGVGFLGVYLACLGSDVVLGDVPSMRDLAERNININRQILKGKVSFSVANWKNKTCVNKCEEMSEGQSSTSSEKQECLSHLMERIDLTVVCECGGLSDLQHHLQWVAREGLILCFLERSFEMAEDFLSSRALEEYLLETELHFERVEQYHPDYYDERVKIYHIWK